MLERVGGFAAFLDEEFDEAQAYAALRAGETAGRPAADRQWVEEMQERTGRQMLPRKRGPKPKAGQSRPTGVKLGEK